METSMKRNIILIVSLLIAILIGAWVVRQMSFGSLSITTNEQRGEITLQQLGGTQKPKKVGKGDSTIRLSPGDYTAEMTLGDKVTRGATTITRGEESNLNLQIQDLKSQDEVTNYTALSIYASSSSLSFLNVPQKLLYKYPLGGAQADMISETYPVTQVHHWYSADSAFFQIADGTYYLRSNGTDTKISLTGDPNVLSVDTLDINDKGELVYVSGESLYYRPSVSGSSSEIASLKGLTGAPHVALSSAGIVLVSLAPDGSGDNTSDTSETSPAILVNITKKQKKNLTTIIANGHWSPDGKRFIGTTARGLEMFSAAGAPLTLVSSLADSGANTVTWIDNSRFIYADNNTVWLYTIIDGVSTKIAKIDGSLARNNPFAVSGTSIYYETDPKPEPGSVGTIHKISF